MRFPIAMSALGLLLLVGAQGTTIISIKYPQAGKEFVERTQPAKRDLSLSYAATNIDSKEGTRVKTITVIKNVGGVGLEDLGSSALSSAVSSNKQVKLAINPKLHQNEEWASAFRDNFESYGGLPDVPDIDDLFEFVNRKKPEKDTKKEKEKPTEKPTTTKATSPAPAKAPEAPTKASSEHEAEDSVDSDEAIVEKIKGDAELLPHIKQANILRLQAQELRHRRQQHHQQQPNLELASNRLRTKESLINVNYSTPMHSVSQFFENYVQVVPNGYDYTKPVAEPCAVAVPAPNSNSIQVTTPSGRTYDIPQSNSSGSNGGINHPYLAPALTKRTQIQAPAAPAQLPPQFSTVNSIVPPLVQPQQPPGNLAQPQTPSPPQLAVGGGGGGVGGAAGSAGAVSVSTSQRPYLAPSLRHNGLGINRGPPTPQPPPSSSLPAYVNNNGNVLPSYRTNGFAVGPNTYRSRGLKY